MVTYSKITIGGVTYTTGFSVNVVRNATNNSGVFTIFFKNNAGKYSGTFGVNDEVVIYHDSNSTPTNKVFTGIIEKIDFTGKPNNEFVRLTGRDYSARLMDVTARKVYNTTEVSVIIKNLIDTYVTGITYTNVQTTTKTINHIQYKHTSIWEAIKGLALIVDYDFYVDNDKDLHFFPQGSTSSGVTINSSNTTEAQFVENDQETFNRVWVYGSRKLSGFRQNFLGNGTGSVFALDYKPHNTEVLVGGSISRGALFEMNETLTSGPAHLVDFDGQQIVFISGASFGYHVPVNNGSVVINYQRSLPIVKMSEDRNSQDLYGLREKVIINTDVDDPQQATDLAKATLAEFKKPLNQGKCRIKSSSVVSLNPGDTIVCHFPFQNVNNLTFRILEVEYDINTNSLQSENVITVRVSEYQKDIVDVLRSLALEIQKMKSEEISSTDVFTRLEAGAGSLGVVRRNASVWKDDVGDAFILGHAINGVLGSPVLGTYGTQVTLGGGKLGSVSFFRVWNNNNEWYPQFGNKKHFDSGTSTASWNTGSLGVYWTSGQAFQTRVIALHPESAGSIFNASFSGVGTFVAGSGNAQYDVAGRGYDVGTYTGFGLHPFVSNDRGNNWLPLYGTGSKVFSDRTGSELRLKVLSNVTGSLMDGVVAYNIV